MHNQEFKKVTFYFPDDEYVLIKIICAKKKISIKEFITESLLFAIRECQNES